MRRNLLIAAALAMSVSGVATFGLGGQAFAKTAKITCTDITGGLSAGIKITGCTGGNTGGSSETMSATLLENGGTVKWVSGSTTTLTAPTLTSVSAKKCPGYVKGGTNIVLDKASGNVTADTGDGIAVPGTYSGEICLNSSTETIISLLKPMKVT
jgi:hypothetical protein